MYLTYTCSRCFAFGRFAIISDNSPLNTPSSPRSAHQFVADGNRHQRDEHKCGGNTRGIANDAWVAARPGGIEEGIRIPTHLAPSNHHISQQNHHKTHQSDQKLTPDHLSTLA